jgi:hypothetical protein
VGAWDVFDIDDNGTVFGFATPDGDALFVRNLTSGIDLIHRAEGVSVHAIGTPLITNSDGNNFPSKHKIYG